MQLLSEMVHNAAVILISKATQVYVVAAIMQIMTVTPVLIRIDYTSTLD